MGIELDQAVAQGAGSIGQKRLPFRIPAAHVNGVIDL
jgi:hypothetical protein